MNREYLGNYRSDNSLTVFFNTGDPITVSSTNPVFNDIVIAIGEGNSDKIIELISLPQRITNRTKGKFNLVEKDDKDYIYIGDEILPESLSDLLIKMVDVEADTDYLEAFWNNLKENPLKSSRESLFDWINANNVTLTKDGCFIGYKSVTHGYLDHHTRSYDNSPGKIVSMNRDSVNENRDATCSTGLHVANWKYAKNFYSSSGVIVEVKVNPKDVVAVPFDYNCSKIRTCKYEVLRRVNEEYSGLTYQQEQEYEPQHGENNGQAKLTENDVREIRRRSSESTLVLSQEFGVSRSQIRRIINRQNWNHIV